MTTVLLRGLPAAVFAAFDEVTEGLLREYALSAIAGEQPFSLDDVAAAERAKARVAAALPAAPAATVDVTLDLSADEAAEFSLLQAVLDHANRLARTGALLALPVLAEVAALRNWMCDQVVRQAAGDQPSPWQPVTAILEEPGLPPAVWGGMETLPADEAWLVGDDGNRIIGASPAAMRLLGWEDGELVGQRILAVIPPAYRERHVAAFTHGVVTGEHAVLGRPLPLAAHTRDGRDVPITLTLDQHAAQGGRAVYLARLQPR